MRSARHELVVVGNGMVGHRFCRELVQREPDRYHITVFAEEPRPAYDRIHLTSLLRGEPLDGLSLAPRAWYAQHRIDLVLDNPVTSIDRRRRVVVSRSGREARYDALVLATGAEPRMPAIPGADLPGVMPYRSAVDVLTVRLYSRRCASAAILGGGLLGLEVAKSLAELGIETYVIEASRHLLSRQLDPLSADLVHEQIERAGVRIAVQHQVRGIRREPHGLLVELDASPPIAVDLVVVASGVRPRDHLARAGGLAVDDQRGGVLIDDDLTTSDPRILAVGDCARHAGTAYGLIAPGYQMARVAAERLTGGKARFTGGDTSCRLNVAGIEVAVLGDYQAPSAREVVYHDGPVRRVLLLSSNQSIAGLRCVGPWPNLIAVEGAMEEKRRLTPVELQRFLRTGDLWGDDGAEITTMGGYADVAQVCHCSGTTFGQVRAQVMRGCRTLAALAATTGAGSVCGTCRPALAQLCGDRSGAAARARWPLLVASLIALAGVGAFIGLTPLDVAPDGPAAWLSQFWRDTAGKKLSGFTLVGVSATSLVLSLRKRVRALRGTPLTWFRVVHAVAGTGSLALLVAHTGMHSGGHLNRALLIIFLAVLVTGGMVGIATASSGRVGGGSAATIRRLRSWFMGSHWLFLWLLPVLVAFHVAAVYYF